MKRPRYRRPESLEMRLCMTIAIGFAEHDIDEAPRHGAPSMILADLDTDGDLDFVRDNFWRANDGTGQFGDERIMFSASKVDILLAIDFDADGDQDMIVASRGDGGRTLMSYQNLDGRGRFGPGLSLPTDDNSRVTLALEAGDFDGDGDLDVIEGGDSPTQVFLNSDGKGTFRLAESSAPSSRRISVYDVDADGVDEVFVVTRDEKLLAMELVQGHLLTRREFDIRTVFNVVVNDVNRDGIADLLVAAEATALDSILWLELTPDLQPSLRQSISVTDSQVIDSMRTADVTGDGNQELIVQISYDGHLTDWYRYQGDAFLPRQMVEGKHITQGGGGAGLVAGDVSGDGIADIVYKTGWKRYDVATDALSNEQPLSPPHVESEANQVLLMDVDLDGDEDLVSTSLWPNCGMGPCGMGIAWHENVDGLGTFGERHAIERINARGKTLLLESWDVDGDGDQDLLFIVEGGLGHELRWLENQDGKGTFRPSQIIESVVRETFIADLNGNGRPDMLQYRSRVLQLTFDVGTPNPQDPPLILQGAQRDGHHLWNPLLDWNGDGKTDLLALNRVPGGDTGTIVWHENLTTEAGVAFAEARYIAPLPSVNDIGFHDLNSDGLLDLIVFTSTRTLEWQQNLGMGQFEAPQTIGADIRVLELGDVDADGDVDLFVGDVIGQSAAWLINDGAQKFEKALGRVAKRVVTHADADADGDLDAFSGNLTWWENRLLGDANGDKVFDSADLVAVLQAGQYEDWIDGNSTFAEGDWNADGDFTSHDLMLALQTGNYVAASRPAASDMAAAVDAQFRVPRHTPARTTKSRA